MERQAVTEASGSFVIWVTITEEHLHQAVRALRPWNNNAILLLFGILGVFGALNLLNIIPILNDYIAIGLVLYAFLFPHLQNQREKKTAHDMMVRCTSSAPPDVQREYTFGEKLAVYSPSTGKRLIYEYSAVKKFRNTERQYLFQLEGSMFVAIPKGCFAEGQRERFERFIREKLGKN